MTKLTTRELSALEQNTLKALHRINMSRNMADYMAAQLGDLLVKRLGSHMNALSFLKLRCKVHSNTADLILKQAKAMALVPSVTSWEAVGWPGVRKIVGLSATKRKTALKQILAAYKKDQKKFGAKRLAVIIGDTGNGAGSSKPGANATRCGECAKLRKEIELLKSALRELADAIPLARRSLTPAVAKLLGARKAV